MRKEQKPNFICVAPHKTGTTWLYMALKSHPQVWLPPKKELWIVNQIGDSYLMRWKNFFARNGMPGDNRRYFEEDIRVRIGRDILKSENLKALWWWLKFLCLPYNFHTYHYLFSNSPDLICGDITPNYYFIQPSLIQQLSKHNPDVRILLILREPVERAWSYTRMSISATLQKGFEDISHDEFVRFFDQIHHWWRPYLYSIQMWGKYFPQLYVSYYDVLQESPREFYSQICAFLEIDDLSPKEKLEQVINQGRAVVLPEDLRQYLNRQYVNEIRELATWSDSPYPKKWLREMEQNISS